jgi:hypothetical protein
VESTQQHTPELCSVQSGVEDHAGATWPGVLRVDELLRGSIRSLASYHALRDSATSRLRDCETARLRDCATSRSNTGSTPCSILHPHPVGVEGRSRGRHVASEEQRESVKGGSKISHPSLTHHVIMAPKRRTVHPIHHHVHCATAHNERARFETHDTTVHAPKE